MTFKDHFSRHAATYAAARPLYPDALYAFLLAQCQARQLAWDCATGNGQAAVALAAEFERVIATDASQAQLDQALAHPRVEYLCLAAEQAPTTTAAIDLVTVAQALHWFDISQFFDVVDAVLKPGGVLAIWSYGLTQINPAVDRVVHTLYADILGEYWPPERRFVESGYAGISFPFTAITAPQLSMRCDWSLQQLLDYLLSWSATQRYISTNQHNPLEQVTDALQQAWGEHTRQPVYWPLTLKVSRK